jgi:hypothetical protein
MPLALLADAFLAVTRARATSPERAKGGPGSLTGGLGLLPLTVPAVGRPLVALVWITPVRPGLRAGLVQVASTPSGSRQAAHYHCREGQVRLEY